MSCRAGAHMRESGDLYGTDKFEDDEYDMLQKHNSSKDNDSL
jgi:hypothetical protein